MFRVQRFNSPYLRFLTLAVAVLFANVFLVSPIFGQKVAKYGADFLAGGVGARALGMGGAHIAIASDANAGYWNPAGLEGITYPEISYMHAERFSGVVSFDFAGVAWPLSDISTIGVSFYRSGVNDIKNTLDAWDSERNAPKPNPEDFITSFSAADYAFFFGYGRTISRKVRIGVTGKIIRRTIGDFADAWGYSFDVGLQYRSKNLFLGFNAQDITTMLQSWSVNDAALINIRDVFGDDLPKGGTELVLPVLRLGSGYMIHYTEADLTFAFDVDVAFDGQQANAINLGDASFHPRLGVEYMYKGVVALRGGFSRIQHSTKDGWDVTPSVGAGFRIKQIQIDYGFGDFAGLVSELGFSHRISLKFSVMNERFRRDQPD
ncbi:MAG: hypothetical protein BMS9Abin05_0084 [Rhodothermia bacterium]|nr:MAG: hypothetical protein BMS9Abin05_0084 [Rhodothermia bacterium]